MKSKTTKSVAVPNDVRDDKLGLVRFDHHLNAEMDAYLVTIELSGVPVEITLYTDADLNITPTIKRARELVRRHSAIQKRASKYLKGHELINYNDVWRTDNDPKLTIGKFFASLTLESIVVLPDGTATYSYDDGGLFAGHCVDLELDANAEFVDSDTSG